MELFSSICGDPWTNARQRLSMKPSTTPPTHFPLSQQQSIVLPKLFGELRFRYRDRSKDFTRIWLYGYRQNDRGARAMIELVDSPKDTQSLFAIEYLPKLRKDLDLIRLKLIAAQRTKEPDAYKRHLLRKEIMELEGKERFFERLITRLEYSLQDKKRADESRVDWAKWEVNHEVKAKKAVMDDIRTKLEVYGRLGGHMDDADLRRLIETRKYDGAHQARISWDDWTAYLAGGEETVKPNEKSTRLLEEMLSRQREGLRMMEEVVGDAAAAGGSVPAATTSTATAAEGEKSDEGASDGDKKRAGGSSLFSRLLGLGGQR